MKILLIIGCYLIGVVISTIIFLKIFKYEAPKDGYGRRINEPKNERNHYICISILSWLYPISMYIIILYYVISYIISALTNFTILINKYINKL